MRNTNNTCNIIAMLKLAQMFRCEVASASEINASVIGIKEFGGADRRSG